MAICGTERSRDIAQEDHILKIFNHAYLTIRSSIQQNKWKERNTTYLCNFLLRYNLVTKIQFRFDIVNIMSDIRNSTIEAPSKELQLSILGIVLGKMNGQRTTRAVQSTEALPDILRLSSRLRTEDELRSSLESITSDAELQSTYLYLLCLPEEHPNFVSSRMMLGRVLLDNNENRKAARCFLEAARLSDNTDERQDALMQAVTALYAKNRESGEIVLREGLDETTLVGLSIEETRSYAAHINEMREAAGLGSLVEPVSV